MALSLSSTAIIDFIPSVLAALANPPFPARKNAQCCLQFYFEDPPCAILLLSPSTYLCFVRLVRPVPRQCLLAGKPVFLIDHPQLYCVPVYWQTSGYMPDTVVCLDRALIFTLVVILRQRLQRPDKSLLDGLAIPRVLASICRTAAAAYAVSLLALLVAGACLKAV